MKRNGVFIAGTDTGVGKTVVTAALVTLLRREGLDAAPMKPVQTGCPRGEARQRVPPDLEFVLQAAGMADCSSADRLLMCPYRFKAPCSPHLAAQREGREIDVGYVGECFNALCRTRDVVVVEGAGGILVPLTADRMMLDLAAQFGIPVVLVSRPGLGTINHTLLSLREMDRGGVRVLGVVLNDSTPARRGYIERDNEKTIERLGRTVILGRLPFIGNPRGGSAELRPGAVSRRAELVRSACVALRRFLRL
jgi:dethiobiotin synthetase